MIVRDELPRSPNGKFDRSPAARSELGDERALRPSSRVRHCDGQLAVGGVAARAARRAGRQTPFFAYDRGCSPSASTRCAGTLPAGIRPELRRQGEPDARGRPAPGGARRLPSTSHRPSRCTSRSTRSMPRDAVSFAGPGQDARRARAGGRRRHHVEIESQTEAARVVDAGERLGVRPRVAVRVNPDFEVKGSGMRMGGGPQQFGVDAEQVPAAPRAIWRARTSTFVGFHIFAGSQNLNAEILCEAQRKTVELALELADVRAPSRCATEPRRRLRHPVLRPATSRSTSRRSAPTSRTLLDERDPPELPDARLVIELGRYIVGECRRLRDPRRRPQGLARQDVPRRRRRPAPPARRVGQLRPGDPQELSGRDRQPDATQEPTRRSASSAASARRSTCSATTSRFRRARSATSSSSSRPAPTG